LMASGLDGPAGPVTVNRRDRVVAKGLQFGHGPEGPVQVVPIIVGPDVAGSQTISFTTSAAAHGSVANTYAEPESQPGSRGHASSSNHAPMRAVSPLRNRA
jgi:hypothetical protein